MAVKFPDIEPVLVTHLKSALTARGQSVRVGTVKLAANQAQPAKQVVITAAYQGTRLHVVQDATATLEVYANTYADASELALLVAALVVDVPRTSIKRCEVSLGPIRVADEGPQEKRSMTVELTVKGQDI